MSTSDHHNFQLRNNKGRFDTGPIGWEEGLSPEHKAKIRRGAILRAQRDYKKIFVDGKIYANLQIAEKEVGVSARALRRYAESDNSIFKHIYFITEEV